jgi:hypothetical protein
MVLPFSFPATLISAIRGSGRGEEPSGANVLRLIQIRLIAPSLEKISAACQLESPPVQVADSSSTKAVSFSSACTTKRFPSSRCASATKIVRRLKSTVATQPQLQPALLRLSAMIFQLFTRRMKPTIAPIVVRISVNSEDCCYLSLITIHCSLQSSGRLAQW